MSSLSDLARRSPSTRRQPSASVSSGHVRQGPTSFSWIRVLKGYFPPWVPPCWAQESNLPSRGLHDRTGFEDQLGHRAHAAPNPGYQADFAVSRASSTALGLPLVYPERPQRVIPSRCFDQPVRHQVPVDTERDARIGVAGVDPPARHAQANASSAGLRSGSPNAFAQGQRSLLQCHSGGGPRSIPRLSPVASAKRSLDRQRGVAAALSHGAHGVLLLECEPGRQ
jgi:hypothetical protein